jgi:tetratricopeptide (TPR) repeat protein
MKTRNLFRLPVNSDLIFLWFWLFIIPVSYNFWGLDPTLYNKFLLLDASLFMLACILIWRNRTKTITINRAALIFYGLYLLYFFISAFSLLAYKINTSDGFFTWLHLLTLPIFVLLLIEFNKTTIISRKPVAKIISYLAAVSILIGLIQFFYGVLLNGWSVPVVNMMSATYAHKNIFSEVLLLTLPFSFYLGFFEERKKINKIIALSTLIMIVMILSRAVWLGFIAGCLTCYIIYFFARKRNLNLWYQPVLILSGLAITVCIYLSFFKHVNPGGYLTLLKQKGDSIWERNHLWSATWRIIQSYILFGSGLGSWKVLNMQYAIVGLRNYTTFFQQPHNDVLWILSEQGIIAFLIVSAAWLYILSLLVRRILVNPNDTFLYCLLFALVGYFVYSTMSFPRERIEHAIILSFIVFFILKDERKNSYVFSVPNYFLFIPLIVIAAGCWWAGHKMVSEIQLRNYFEARTNNNISDEFSHLDNINPVYFALDGTATPIAWYKGMAYFSQNNIDDALADFTKAVKFNPYHVYSLTNLGTCLDLKGDKAGAEKYFKLALKYSPGFPDAALNLCALKYNEKKIDSAAWYLGMVNDSTENIRYVQFLKIIITASVKPLMETAKQSRDSILMNKFDYVLNNSQCQMNICRESYCDNRLIREEIIKYVIWSFRNIENNSILADHYKVQFKQE